MIIIAGTHKGLTLRYPPSRVTRPVGDKVRAAIFDVLGDISGARVLDAYAGSGALGFEALSRGALMVEAIEAHRLAVKVIEENQSKVGFMTYFLHKMTVEHWLALSERTHTPRTFDIILADPPYDHLSDELLAKLGKLLEKNGVMAVSHTSRLAPPMLESLRLVQAKRYGDASVSFYRPE